LKIQINSKKTRFWKEKSVKDVVTLGPRAQATQVYIYIYYVKYKKMKINDVLKIDNNFHPNSSNLSCAICNDNFMGLLFISGTPIPKGNKARNMHAIKFGLLYIFIVHYIVMIVR
jgi:hypothetical protein